MDTKLTENFFARWKPLAAQKRADCPPDQILASLAKGTASEDWDAHVTACDQCKKIVDLLRQPAEERSKRLQEFLEQVRQEADKVARPRRSFVPADIAAWFSGGSADRAGTYAFVTALVLMGFWLLANQLGVFRKDVYSTTLSLNRGDYGRVAEELRTAYEGRRTADSEVKRLNVMLEKIDLNQLGDRQRSNLTDLVQKYQAIVNQRARPRAPAVQGGADSGLLTDLKELFPERRLEFVSEHHGAISLKDPTPNPSPATQEELKSKLQQLADRQKSIVELSVDLPSGPTVMARSPTHQLMIRSFAREAR